MNQKKKTVCRTITVACLCAGMLPLVAQPPVTPPAHELNAPFGNADREAFKSPPQVYHPETWFHYIGGNVAAKGITADLEAIAGAGISGIQLFHGQFGGPWPGMDTQITCLSPSWDDAVRHTAEECRRLGLRLTMQNCPGWAMSGGPWIEPSNAMRHLAWSRTDVEIKSADDTQDITLPIPQPSDEPWRDYKDIAVLAFPTPLDDTNEPLRPQSIKSSSELPWEDCLSGMAKEPLRLSPSPEDKPHWIEVTFPDAVALRTVEFPSINGFSHAWCYEPGVTVTVQAILPDGRIQDVLHTDMPQSSWQDDRPISLACSEADDTKTYRISIANKHDMSLRSLRLFSAARKNNWESEAGWTLRDFVRAGEHPKQSPAAFVNPAEIRDLSAIMDGDGHLKGKGLTGKWTILRIGHVNTGQRNGPAPPEGTGWECDKLSEAGPDAHFAGYIGRLSGQDGLLANGLLNGMLMDSWECKTQTWTTNMEAEFENTTGYPLRQWLPAVFGYVVGDPETTTRFLLDWRGTIGYLFADKFYGRMAQLAKDNGLAVSYETSAGDIFPADILEYYKYADVPMCEFWQPFTNTDGYVGSLNFKPIKPAASAARLYGKPRVAAEAFTSFALTWDEHLEMLKEVTNINSVEGVTHLVFHTYTHNPRTDFLPPGTSFGSGIGTPFLRGQTWWKYMPEFTAYLARCSYLLERGKPVSDVLWYLGDEISHKPDQNIAFPDGFKYDYCNLDVLLNRLSVSDGMLVTPEGISYRLMWLPDNQRMLPQTLEKIRQLVRDGATIAGDAPYGLATLSNSKTAQQRFDAAVRDIWGDARQAGARKVGKGTVISGRSIDDVLNKSVPDVTVRNGNALWTHRQADGADWYYVCAPRGSGFNGTIDFRNNSDYAEIWDPLTGGSTPVATIKHDGRASITIDLPQAGSCFVVFRNTLSQDEKTKHAGILAANPGSGKSRSVPLTAPWTLAFPSGWDAPSSLQIKELKAWKDLNVSSEAKAFSGTVTYTTTFDAGEVKPGADFSLDLGRVEMIAAVSLNGKPLRTLWTSPYRVDLTGAIKSGVNTLTIDVTGTWFNRLVYDAAQPETNRKTWTINGPDKNAALRESGLIGPVVLNSKIQ
ncbi:MAG: hypothetical protein LBN71_07040 [Tannerella sp.]|jgi:hypothetical protein|nr:hypothetical protein [Tannerella sp.]